MFIIYIYIYIYIYICGSYAYKLVFSNFNRISYYENWIPNLRIFIELEKWRNKKKLRAKFLF